MMDHKELEVWQKAFELVLDVYKIVEKLPKNEKFVLSDQVRRSAISIPSNIAEGHDRGSTKEFIHFLYISLGSAAELETQLLMINKIYLVNVGNEIESLKSIRMMINKLISSLKRRVKQMTKSSNVSNLDPQTPSPEPRASSPDLGTHSSIPDPRSPIPEVAIKVENLTKIYPLYDKHIDRMKEALHPFRKKYHQDFYALKDVSFEIKKGETVGIIGKNGAGKSTLLKILTGVLTPTSGSVHVNGRVSSLLELGTGFNPELTGMENIYFFGTVNGVSKKEMDSKVDEIIDFAEIGEFIHQPVKSYSSGMFARLAFSVAISIEPEILIVDEVLSVGDFSFQRKCMKKIDKLRDDNVTVLYVSHDVSSVRKLCTMAMWFNKGECHEKGDPEEIVRIYSDYMDSLSTKVNNNVPVNNASNEAKIVEIKVLDLDYKPLTYIKNPIEFYIEMTIEFYIDMSDFVIGCAVFDAKNVCVSALNTTLDGIKLNASKGKHTYSVLFKNIALGDGSYFFDVGVFEKNACIKYDYLARGASLTVVNNDYKGEGIFTYPHEWII